ncbi:unnamed protein product [Moneuplotes crassus]|uniref:Transmembrane protein n=1 Tax=Euplotes crassus TaxID=5936 RepID=A0AAD1UCU2_EUPCR|nr:unnamed protein product [Moneuplotes crassus]
MERTKLHAFSEDGDDMFNSDQNKEGFEIQGRKFFSQGCVKGESKSGSSFRNYDSDNSYHNAILRKEYASNSNDGFQIEEKMDESHSTEEISDEDSSMNCFQKCFKKKNKPFWFAGILAISIFLERFCFLVTVYKTREHGYVLILCVAFLNSMFALFQTILKKKKHKKNLYEYYQLRKTPKVGICIYILISVLDIFYVFFLFWSANTIPIAALICLLQLFIPFNMIIRRFFLNQPHNLIHWISGSLILIGCGLCFVRVFLYESPEDPVKYLLFFALSSLLKVISLGIKEGLVRSQPINNEKFNFKTSLGQFLIGVILTPIIVNIYTSSDQSESSGSTWQNIGTYLADGFRCVTSFSEDQKNQEIQGCSFALFYILMYTISTFLFQIVLKALLERRKFLIIKRVFSCTFLITLASFALGYLAIPGHQYFDKIVLVDLACVFFVMIGVFFYDETPAKISVEKF